MLAPPRAALLGADPYPAASLVFDFRSGFYRSGAARAPAPSALSAWSFSRAGAGLAQRIDGQYAAFGSGAERITDRGLLIEEARTNKLSVANANPANTMGLGRDGDAAAILSLVDDSAALAAAGLAGVVTAGVVYRFDNSAGVAEARVSVLGLPGNTNTHCFSAFVRGAGTVGFRQGASGGTTFRSPVALTTGYVRVTGAAAPGQTNSSLRLVVPAAGVLWFSLPQLEEAAFATSPIVTSGSAATRAADAATIDLTGLPGSQITVDYGAATSVVFSRASLANPNQLVLSASAGGAWKNDYVRRVAVQ